jgi:hypothetical protein
MSMTTFPWLISISPLLFHCPWHHLQDFCKERGKDEEQERNIQIETR